MTNLFKKIREQLLQQRQFSKYLLYAIGEIILVVLGILIALQINNSNTNRINKELEREYLSAIHDNINEDIQDLKQRLSKDSLHLDAYTQLLKTFTSDSLKANEPALKFAIHNSAVINYFNPQSTVFEEMKSSGKLHLIQSNAMRYGILEYYNQSKKIVTSQQINNEYILANKDQSIDKYLDMNSLIESQLPPQWNAEMNPFDKTFFDKDIADPEVENFSRSISLMKAGVWINHNWKKGLLEKAETIKAVIEQYLSEDVQTMRN